MKPLTSAVLPLLALFGLTDVPAAAAEPSANHPITLGTRYTLPSTVLGDTRELNVWLPPGYDASNQRYPVVYLLDGAVEQDFVHIAGLGSLASLSWTFGPFIVVGIQTRDRKAELTERPVDPRYIAAFPKSGGANRFRRYLRQEVIPLVESRYRTSGKRALMGESLAGLFVVDTLLAEPALFNDYIAISPSLWWDDRRMVRALAPVRQSPATGKRLFLAMANEGGTMQDGVDRLRRWLAPLPRGQIALNYVDYSRTATHDTVYHHAAETALRWLYPAPPYAGGPTPWYMFDGAKPPKVR
jgi:predicted alpha/beta superfamily hydrolase